MARQDATEGFRGISPGAIDHRGISWTMSSCASWARSRPHRGTVVDSIVVVVQLVPQ